MLMSILAVSGIVLFILALVVGLLLTIVGLPGNWLILVAGVLYAWATGFEIIPLWLLGVLFLGVLIAEVADNLMGAAGVKKYGGSNKGMMWSVVVGLIGAFAGGSLLSVSMGFIGGIIGPIVGGLLGGFLGGYWYELRQGRSKEEARKAGIGALMGRTAGMILKGVTAAVMVVVLVMQIF